jgi:hypothetical protein
VFKGFACMNISLQDIWVRLAPSYPNILIGVTVYIMMACSLINMFMQKKSDTRIAVLCTLVIMLCLVDKVAVGRTGEFPIGSWSLEAFLLRMPMFVAPLITAGMTKWDKARPWGVIGGFLGGAYLFSRWFFEQREF